MSRVVESISTRRPLLHALGAFAAALFVLQSVWNFRLEDLGGAGIVDLELAWTAARVAELVAAWGDDGRATLLWALWVDYPMMVAYGLYFAALALLVARRASARGHDRAARIARTAMPLPLVAAVLDAIENAGLLVAVGGRGGDLAPLVASASATLKFVALAAAAVAIGGSAVASRRNRSAANTRS